MRKIETIKKEIERAQAAIRKAEEALPRLETRMNNAIAKLAQAGYEFKGDGNDTRNCLTNGLWSRAYTANEAREGIERCKAKIAGRKMDLDHLNRELAEAEAKVNAIPQAIKVNGIVIGDKSHCEVVRKGVDGYKGAALCRNALRWDYSAKGAIEDRELVIKAAEATRNKEPSRQGRRAWDIPRKR